MKRALFLCLLTCLSHAFSFGQTVRVLNSTQQSWSGGVAGRYGTNYYFEVEFSNFHSEPLPDTLWIGQKPISLYLSEAHAAALANMKCSRKKNTITYQINAGTSYDDYASHYAPPGQEEKKELIHAPLKYKGAALLSYRYMGKRHFFEITKVKTAYPPVNYP